MAGSASAERPSLAPVQRAVAYEFLARCLAYPHQSAIDALRSLRETADQLLPVESLAGPRAQLASASREELEAAHIETFTAVTSPDCPTYESAFVCTDPAQQPIVMADVSGYYRAFGLEVSAGGERPDDACVELSFLGYLCRKEAYAADHLGPPRVRQARRAQRLFLREHLGRWAEAFGDCLVTSGAHQFYRELGVALGDWIAAEVVATGAEPVDRIELPRLPWPRPERGGGPDFGAPNGLISLEDIVVGR